MNVKLLSWSESDRIAVAEVEGLPSPLTVTMRPHCVSSEDIVSYVMEQAKEALRGQNAAALAAEEQIRRDAGSAEFAALVGEFLPE
jgi:hypothetical protein